MQWCEGDFLAHLTTNWALFKHHSLHNYCCWPCPFFLMIILYRFSKGCFQLPGLYLSVFAKRSDRSSKMLDHVGIRLKRYLFVCFLHVCHFFLSCDWWQCTALSHRQARDIYMLAWHFWKALRGGSITVSACGLNLWPLLCSFVWAEKKMKLSITSGANPAALNLSYCCIRAKVLV